MSSQPDDVVKKGGALEKSCGIVIVVGGIIFIVFVSFFFLGFIKKGYYAARLLSGHETTQATVTRTGIRRSPSRYEFTIEGEEYHGQGGKEQEGERIEVAYLDSSPDVNRPADDLFMDVGFAIGVPVFVVGIGLVWLLRERLNGPVATTSPEEAPGQES